MWQKNIYENGKSASSREFKLWHLTVLLPLQVPAAHVRTLQQPGFLICFSAHELYPLRSVSFSELRRHNILAFSPEESFAGGAVIPTAHMTHPSFLRTVHQPD